MLVAGGGSGAAANAAATISGVSRVLHIDDAAMDHAVAEVFAQAVLDAQAKYGFTHIVAVASNAGKNVAPRIAVRRDVAPITDVTAVLGEDTFERPMYAGNAIARVRSSDAALRVLTVRPTAFEKAKVGGGGSAAPVEAAAAPAAGAAGRCATWIGDEVAKSERPELTGAATVVAGGRALKSGENFNLLYALADKLGAAVGASRAAVDAGACAWGGSREGRRESVVGARPRSAQRCTHSRTPARPACHCPRACHSPRARAPQVTCPTTCRWGRRARSSRPTCTSPSAFRARSSTSRA